MTSKCPECGCNDPGLMVGHIERGVYDGVLWWECGSCGWGWPRDFAGRAPFLAGRALRRATEHNAAGSAGETRR